MLHLYCSNLDMKNAHILLPDGYNWFKSRVWTKLVLGIQIYGLVYKKGALVFQVTLFKETNNILITDHEIKEDQKEVYFLYKPIQISLLVYLFDLLSLSIQISYFIEIFNILIKTQIPNCQIENSSRLDLCGNKNCQLDFLVFSWRNISYDLLSY